MTTTEIRKFLNYLGHQCGGIDAHSFWTDDGLPDLDAARSFAEVLREQFGPYLDDLISVEQRVNVVRIKALAGDLCVS